MDKLDRSFSLYIRLRDADDNGICTCCSCGKKIHWKKADAGHFINRKHKSVRWNEKNVHAQCRECNRFDEGNIPGYFRFMQRKYGDNVIDLLYSAKRETVKLSKFEINALTREYNSKANEIKKHLPLFA